MCHGDGAGLVTALIVAGDFSERLAALQVLELPAALAVALERHLALRLQRQRLRLERQRLLRVALFRAAARAAGARGPRLAPRLEERVEVRLQTGARLAVARGGPEQNAAAGAAHEERLEKVVAGPRVLTGASADGRRFRDGGDSETGASAAHARVAGVLEPHAVRAATQVRLRVDGLHAVPRSARARLARAARAHRLSGARARRRLELEHRRRGRHGRVRHVERAGGGARARARAGLGVRVVRAVRRVLIFVALVQRQRREPALVRRLLGQRLRVARVEGVEPAALGKPVARDAAEQVLHGLVGEVQVIARRRAAAAARRGRAEEIHRQVIPGACEARLARAAAEARVPLRLVVRGVEEGTHLGSSLGGSDMIERHLGESRVLADALVVERERVVEVDVARHGEAAVLAARRVSKYAVARGALGGAARRRRRPRVVAQGVAVTRGERVAGEARAERRAVLEQEVQLFLLRTYAYKGGKKEGV